MMTKTIADTAFFLRLLAAHLEENGMIGKAGDCSTHAASLEFLISRSRPSEGSIKSVKRS